jgi:hypothetical protein
MDIRKIKHEIDQLKIVVDSIHKKFSKFGVKGSNIVKEYQALIEIEKNLITETKAFKRNPFAGYPKEDEMIRYFRIDAVRCGLPVDIAADSSLAYKFYKHPLWVYAQCEPDNDEKWFYITVEPQPRILGTNGVVKLNRGQIIDIKKFIVKNQKILKDIADTKIRDYRVFFKQLIPLNDIPTPPTEESNNLS